MSTAKVNFSTTCFTQLSIVSSVTWTSEMIHTIGAGTIVTWITGTLIKVCRKVISKPCVTVSKQNKIVWYSVWNRFDCRQMQILCAINEQVELNTFVFNKSQLTNTGARTCCPFTSFSLIIPDKFSWTWTVVVQKAIGAGGINITTTAGMVVPISHPSAVTDTAAH